MAPDPSDHAPTDEDRRAALLAEMGIALIEAGSVDEVLQRLADAAREVSRARYAAIGVIDAAGTGLARFITSGVDEATRERIGALPVGRGLLGAITKDATAIRVADIAADPRSVGFPEGHPPMTSFLGLPIRLRDRVFGNIYVAERAEGCFSDEDQRLMETLAAYAAIAIRGGEIRAERDRWIDGLEGICSISGSIARSMELSVLMPEATRRARGLLACDTVGIALLHDGSLSVPYAHGPHALELEALPAGEPGLAQLRERIATRLPDHDALVEPMIAQGAEVGALVVVAGSTIGRWHRRVVEVLASHVAVTIANAEDFQEQRRQLMDEADLRLRESEQRLARDAQARALRAQEEERARVARELHDETSQLLSGLGMRLKALSARADDDSVAAEAEQLRAHVKDVQASMRQILRRLRPADLEHGLGSAISETAQRVQESADCEVTVEVSALPPVDPEVELVLYRVSQEALTNVARHSRASHATVVLVALGDRLRLTIEDDGVGFRPRTDHDGFGLTGIAERIDLVGGRLRVTSSPGAGTAVTVDVAAKPAAPETA